MAVLDELQRDDEICLGESIVGDLGCGGGILALGAALLGAPLVIGFDVDAEALKICRRNAKALFGDEADGPCIELVQTDLTAFQIPTSDSKNIVR